MRGCGSMRTVFTPDGFHDSRDWYDKERMAHILRTLFSRSRTKTVMEVTITAVDYFAIVQLRVSLFLPGTVSLDYVFATSLVQGKCWPIFPGTFWAACRR